MEQLGDRIRKLRESRNMTQTELSEILGMKTYTTVSKWEKNENFPKGKDLKKLAEIFNVTSDYLLGLSDTKLGKITTQNEPPEILTIYNQLEDPNKEKVLDYATVLLNEQNNMKTSTVLEKYKNDEDYITDYVEGLVAAGHGTFQEDNLHMEVRLRAEDVPEDYDTIAKVAGDSMEPLIEDNDLLFIKVSSQVDINSIGIFQVNGKNFVKKLKRDYDGSWYLQSLNSGYEEIYLSESDDIRTIGKVVDLYREK
ncbi:helix-turn-helix domain-containing protein [Streptococcus sp. K0074]|uniref:helix-turn-helix domain-containing protein n=1 Tax=Streptococcus sp. K0074 TaxID=3402868 RepID=UPI003B684B9F